MKRAILLSAFIFGIATNSIAQQISLEGVVTVQNSKTNFGETQYVKNAELTHPKAKSEVTGDDGKFTLKIQGIEWGRQVQIFVTLHGAHKDYEVVNEKELQSIILGQKKPVSVYICKKIELEDRRAAMIGINMKKYTDQIKLREKERDDLEAKYDYESARYKILEKQIDSLRKVARDMNALIQEWAESLTTINLDDQSEMYVKAYQCFANGHLDSVSHYLPDVWLKQQQEELLRQQEEGKKKVETGQILIEAGQRDLELAKAGLADNVKSWMLKAKAMALENRYEQAINYYEEAVNTDSQNTANLFEFASYLHSIREYGKAEKYYLQCLESYRILGKENPNAYLADRARILNNLAILHRVTNEHSKALEKNEEALEIRRMLAQENPKEYLADVAQTLNNLAILHDRLKEYPKALEEYEEALEIRRNLAAENPKEYLAGVAQTLTNIGILHWITKEYQKAAQEHEEALEIRRNLAAENPKTINGVATTLVNLAIVHYDTKEYDKALEEYTEALEIYRNLATENPKAYLTLVARTLDNLANLHEKMNEYQKALEGYEEALEIRRNLAVENPKAYLVSVAETLNNLAELYQNNKKYPKAVKEYEEALKIYRKFATESPKVYSDALVRILTHLSQCYLFAKAYTQSEQFAREALALDSAALNGEVWLAHSLLLQGRYDEAEKIYATLLQTNVETGRAPSLQDNLEELEKAGAIPEERNDDVEKIRKMLNNE